MKVTRGDTVNMTAHAHYQQTSNSSGFNFILFITNTYDDTNSENLLGNLSLGLGFSSASGTRLPDVPYAYLKYVVYRADSSIAAEGEQLVTSDAQDSWDTLSLSTVIEEDGYIKIYMVNEDPVDVWFDDITIDHIQSPIAQQTDYYPFGLEIAGTQYNREEWLGNCFGYNGKEKDVEMGWIDYGARMYQPSIGRWNRIDDQFERYIDVSPYVYCVNNPLFYVDPDGESLLGWAIRFFLTYKKYDQAEEVYRIVDQYDFDPQTRNGILFIWGAVIQAHRINVLDAAWGTVKENNAFSIFFKAYEAYHISTDENLSSEEKDRQLLSLIPILGHALSLADAYENFTSEDIDYFQAGQDAIMVLQDVVGSAEGVRGFKRNYNKPSGTTTQPPSENGTKPYTKSRPSYGKGQVDEVWNNAKKRNGKVYDPNTGQEITWDRSKSRRGQWDMGYKRGHEYRKYWKKYVDGEISKDKFLDIHRNSDFYQPELPGPNRSRKFELD